jgi:hypothetical protein
MVTDVVLEHVRISSGTAGLTIRNANGIRLEDAHVIPAQGSPVIVQDARVEGLER